MVGASPRCVKPGPCGGFVKEIPAAHPVPTPPTPHASIPTGSNAKHVTTDFLDPETLLTRGHVARPPMRTYSEPWRGYACRVELPPLQTIDLDGPVAYREWD